LSFR